LLFEKEKGMNGFLKNGLLVVGGVVLGSMMTQKAIVDTLRQNQRECQEVLFETRGDVEKILDTLNYCISKYGCVTLADFYDLAGVRALYEDCKFGWTTLNGVKVVRKRDGYTIEFPRAMPVT
jgi:hypothetical protein